jgi:hypothetical protein
MSAALLLTLVGACSGDDTEPPLSKGESDASTRDASTVDGSVADATTAADASDAAAAADAPLATADATPDGADAAPPTLACTTWRYATPVVLETISFAYSFSGALFVGEPATGQVRVITQPTIGTGIAFRVYDFDEATTTFTTLDGPAMPNATYESARHVAGGASPVTQVLVQDVATDGSAATELTAFLLPDSLTTAGPAPSPIQVAAGGLDIAALPFTNGDVFAAVASANADDPPEIDYALRVGLATPATPATLAQIVLSPHADDFQNLALAHVGSDVYLFATNGNETPGESAWTVPDTGAFATAPTTRAFDTAAGSRIVDLGPAAAGGATNFAYVSTNAGDGGGSSVAVRVGQVADAQMGSVTAADLPVVQTYSDSSASPVAEGRAEWSGDDVMIVGPGATLADGGAPAGANLLWVDARGNVRAEQVGASAILRSEPGAIETIVASPASVSATAGAWNVAWVETTSGGEVLLFNELDCQ